MEKELDLATARFIKEQQDRERQEEVERLLKQFDPKKNTTYTLEELTEGIRKCCSANYLHPDSSH